MPFVDDAGVSHPLMTDPVTAESLRHIGSCKLCMERFDHPYIRQMILGAEFSAEELRSGVLEVPDRHEPESKEVRKWWQFWKR